MTLKLFSMYDLKACAYGPPLAAPMAGVALRWLMRQVQDKESDIGRFPGDYELFELGELDTMTGKLTVCGDGPRLVMKADQALPDV